MKYSLGIRKKNCKPLEITGFNKLPGFEHLSDTSLEDIVKFTHSFDNEVELAHFLIQNNLMPNIYFSGEFGIDYFKSKKDSEGKTLQYGISFQNDKKFYDTRFLQEYFSYHLKEDEFREKFLQKYYTQLKNVPIFKADLENIKYKYYRKNPYQESYLNSVYSFIFYYTHTKNKNNEYMPNFTRIRDLAMFAIDYKRRNEFDYPLPDMDIDSLNVMKYHYEELLQGELLEEERLAYEKQLSNIEEQITLTNKYLKRTRSKKE